MNCPICGSKIREGDAFCDACGASLAVQTPLEAPQPSTTSSAAPSIMPNSSPAESLAVPASAAQAGYPIPAPETANAHGGSYSPYYAQQFAQIAAGYSAGFNPAAFFLGPYHALYRGMTKRFLCAYLPVTILSLLGSALSLMLLGIDENAFLMGMMLSWLISLAGLGVAIWNGVTFNRAFYAKQQGSPYVPARGGHVAALVGGIIGFDLLLMVAAIGVLFATQAPAPDFSVSAPQSAVSVPQQDASAAQSALPSVEAGAALSRYPSDAALATEYYGPIVGAIFSEYESLAPDQAYTRGYAPGTDYPDTQDTIERSYLFANDNITLHELFGEAFSEYEWFPSETQSTDEDAYPTYTLRGILDDTTVQLTFGLYGGTCWLESGMTYLTKDTDENSFYELDGNSACALLRGMYNANSNPTGSAIANAVRGNWSSKSGATLSLDSSFWDGQPYTLWYVSEDTLALWLDHVSGIAGEYYLQLADGGNTLVVMQESAAGSGSSVLEAVETYHRVLH